MFQVPATQTLVVSHASSLAEVVAPPCRVVALIERDSGRRFDLPLQPGRLRLGKAAECDIRLPDPFVSGLHCVLDRTPDDRLLLRDAGSKNGTRLDGSPVIEAELRPGAVLAVGRTYLVAAGDQRPDSALAQLRGSDVAFRAAVDMAVRAARSDVSVLVVGETGTGKDVVARAVHEGSRRAAGPLVPLNCGAIPRELIGSELFGHVRGAFTGATEHRDGLFVHADGGTLFLDELGELPLELQPNLLRVLEVRRVRPIGGLGERAVDVRIVAATNRLDGLGTASSPLREDLYHRVASVVIELPPLRARRDDIVPLAVHFLAELAPRHGRRWLAPAAMDALLTHDWPGNVRELRQAMERAAAMTEETIGPQDLGLVRREPRPAVQRPAAPRRDGWASTTGATTASGCGELTRLEAVERELMAHALNRCGTMRAAARELGMPKSTFAEKAHRYGLRARG